MNFDQNTSTWARICPLCNKTILHKNKISCKHNEKHETPCFVCLGAQKKKEDKCPACDEVINIKKFDIHALSHGLSIEELWIKFKGQHFCACGCGEKTKWKNWEHGYNKFIKGHQLRGTKAWNSGLTKETSNIIAKATEKSVATIKHKFETGEIVPWQLGLTKETDERVACNAKSVSAAYDNKDYWSKGLTKNDDASIMKGANKRKELYQEEKLITWNKNLTISDDERCKNLGWSKGLTSETSSGVAAMAATRRRTLDELVSVIEEYGMLKYVSGYETYQNSQSMITVHCTKCDKIYNEQLFNLFRGACRICTPIKFISKSQQEIDDFIVSLGFTTSPCNRSIISPQEIDVFVPEKNFGIEFNGLYWHDENNKTRSYHDDKSQAAMKAGVNLMHVFGDEWDNKRPIIKSMISAKLGVSQLNLGARKCKIIELDKKIKKTFFEQNHIDGDANNSSHAYGLIFNDELIAALSIRKPQQGKKYEGCYEVARFAQRLNTHVTGGLSRLTKHVIKQIDAPLMTYVDVRMGSSSTSWEKAGWTKIGESTIRFWWTDKKKRFDRGKFKADKKNGLTERQVAELNNVSRIYGCRNLIYKIEQV